MDKKTIILQYVSRNPGVTSADIKVNMSRSSIGSYLRSLLDASKVRQDENKGWYVMEGVEVNFVPAEQTPIDIAEEAIRNMMRVK